MLTGYLYADFLMTHRAYEFASKIAITNKIVYFWRRHNETRVQKSASQEIASCENFRERTRSLLFEQSSDSEVKFKFDDIKLLLLSFVFNDIVDSKVFRNTFMEESCKVLQTIENISEHNVHPLFKLKLWLLREGYINELFYVIGNTKSFQLFSKNHKIYCNLPFFRNTDFNIPDKIYEYKMFRKEFIKNFLYIDNGNSFTFQVLLQHIHCLPKSDYFLFFKDEFGTTKYKYKLNSNNDYFSVDIEKSHLLKDYTKLYLGIGDDDNIVYRINKSNAEPDFDISKKLSYIVRYSWDKKEVYFQKRNIYNTIQKKLKLNNNTDYE